MACRPVAVEIPVSTPDAAPHGRPSVCAVVCVETRVAREAEGRSRGVRWIRRRKGWVVSRRFAATRARIPFAHIHGRAIRWVRLIALERSLVDVKANVHCLRRRGDGPGAQFHLVPWITALWFIDGEPLLDVTGAVAGRRNQVAKVCWEVFGSLFFHRNKTPLERRVPHPVIKTRAGAFERIAHKERSDVACQAVKASDGTRLRR
jgi:hypothetical protein